MSVEAKVSYGTYSQARKKAKQASRDRLIDAACDLVLAHGANAVTIDKIVSAAGLSRPTFYGHFQSREEIFAALRTRMTEILDGLYDMLAAIDSPDAGAVTDWVLKMLAECRRDRKLVLTLIQSGLAMGVTFNATSYYRTVIDRLAARFDRFRQARTDPMVEAKALLLLMQLEGVIRHVATDETDINDQRFASAIADAFTAFLAEP